MILSFHPCFEGDVNRLCAGREPDDADLAAIRAADAVVLPQGCAQRLNQMARSHCPHVFPDYTARFDYPGKIGQIQLFRKMEVSHPQTVCIKKTGDFLHPSPHFLPHAPFCYPFVFKFDWGGGGDNVFLVNSATEMDAALQRAAKYENSGQHGFLIQEYIPAGNRSLRVAVIGSTLKTYWRTGRKSPSFLTNISKGGSIDDQADPDLQALGAASVRSFCGKTGIDLAGFDLLFSTQDAQGPPLFLEINYFFGRRGLGGSEQFYGLLTGEIHKWLRSVGLK